MAGTANRPWVVFGGSFLAAVGFFAYLLAPASLVPVLVSEYAVSGTAASLAISAVFLGWVLLQLPGGVAVDRYDNRWLVGCAGCLLVLAGGAGLFAPTYRAVLVTRFVGGTAAVFLWTANVNIVTSTFPAGRRATAVSLFAASAPAGAAIAQFGSPLLAAGLDPTAVFAAYTLVTAVGVAILAVTLDGPVRSTTRLSRSRLLGTLSSRAVLLASVSSFCTYALFVFFNSWMPTYVLEVLTVELAAAGALAAVVPILGLLARPGGGLLAEYFGGRLRTTVVLAFGVALVALVGLRFAELLPLLVVSLVLAGIGSQLGMGALLVYVTRMTQPETRGSAVAALTTLSMTGALLAPPVGGWLVASHSWELTFLAGGVLAVVGIVAILASPASRTSK